MNTEVQWSDLQNAIFDEVNHSNANIIIEAVAGSGKTTTICEAMRWTASARPLFVAFNKSIAMDLAPKLPSGAKAATLNALGHAVCMKLFPNAKLDQWKVWNIVRKLGLRQTDAVRAAVGLVSFAKNKAVGIEIETSRDWFEDTYRMSDASLFLDIDPSWLARIAHEAFVESLDCEEIFDFDDQVYQPIAQSQNPYKSYDCIFVDEAQDLSPINHLALQAASKSSRIIAVGDTHQAIYGFRGADSSSMRTLKQQFDMVEKPLSITYRCPTSVVEIAQRFCPSIQARPNAPAGTTSIIDALPPVEAITPSDLVICRNNAPLFSIALKFIKAKRPMRLMTNLGVEVIRLIENLEGITADDALISLQSWRDKHIEELEPGDRMYEEIQDRYHCIAPFFTADPHAPKLRAVDAIREAINSKTGPRVSTIHRAKGLEAERVFFERPDLLSDEGQDLNLYYVGVTRAKSELHFRPQDEAADAE